MIRKLTMDEMNRISVEEFKDQEKTPLVVVLDNIRSLNNVGSLFRTADAFLIEALYLCGFTGCPPHREIHKSALGAEESVSWRHFGTTSEAVDELKRNGYKILGLEQTTGSIDINDFSAGQKQKYAMVIGNEVDGISEEVINMCDELLEIPQYGTKHSLNVSVSAAIAIWEIIKKTR